MTGYTRKPTIHLSLVRDKGVANAGKFLNLESLPPEQAEVVQRFHKMISPSGILVGVLIGASEWDLRPIILNHGQMTVSRIFSPQLLSSLTLSDSFKSYVFHVERLFPGMQGLSCGSHEGYAWVTRKYFNQLMNDAALDLTLQEKVSLIGRFLGDLEKLHVSSLVHGHITPSNIAYEDGRLILLDHGFQVHDPGSSHPPTLAPELRDNIAGQLNASPASDMYGVGLVTKRLLGNSLGTDYGNLVEVLLLSDPTLRPKLPQIVAHFVPEKSSAGNGPDVAKPQVPQSAQLIDLTQTIKKTIAPEAIPNKLFQRYLPLFLVLVFLSYFFKDFILNSFSRFHANSSQQSAGKLEKFWDSGQMTLMQQVVGAAFQGDEEAQNLIFDKITNGFTHQAVQTKLFTTALNPAWESDLSELDRTSLLKLGLTSLVPPEFRQLPDLSTLHPGVLMAIVAQMSIGDSLKSIQNVPLKRMSTLPIPYGSAFAALERLGVSNLGDQSAQALCHLLVSDTSQAVITAFFPSNVDSNALLSRLDLLTPVFDSISGLDEGVYKGISSIEEGDAQLFSWFAKDIIAQWTKVPARPKLLLFSGVFPDQTLRFEQYADLLRFPRLNVREKAKATLLNSLPPKLEGMLAFLSSRECKLTRTQTISLIAALQVKSDTAHTFLSQWFDTSPDPTSVAQILIRRPEPEDMDAFNLEAARYLIDKEWTASIEDIKKLALHPESLARALAYSRLRIDNTEEHELLKTYAARETNERMKKQLQERLATP